ncbi:MAG TPA: tetratricopeptide repeat protein [Pyrinomonadaceae bacterium]|nr:tetratricopeptide repeat protein [Pyrinomonadaceae bacterium]HMP64298.1 tetratricopeptide repeat protein [Pyrinomonadaceae bacterium]
MKRPYLLYFIVVVSCVSVSGQGEFQATAEDLFNEGIRLLRERDYQNALAVFQKSASMDSRQPSTHANIGAVLLALNEPEGAESAYRRAIDLDPQNGEFYGGLCTALSMQKKHIDALDACDTGIRLSPDSERVHAARLQALEHSGHNFNEILAIADKAVSRFRQSELILITAIELHLIAKNLPHAANLLESLILFRPGVAPFHGRLAEVYLRLGRDTESLEQARRALELNRDDPYGNYAMGLIFFELGQHREAAESFSRVPTSTRRIGDAAYYRAVSLSRMGRPQEAVDLLNELVSRVPSNPTFQLELAKNLSTLHRKEEAIRAFQKAYEISPDDTYVLAGLGTAYMSIADFENAIKYFEAALVKSPDEEILQMFLRVARSRQMNSGRINDLTIEVESTPKDVQKRLDLIRLLGQMNRIVEAEKYVSEIYELDPPDPAIYQMIGVVYAEAGLNDKAFDAYRRSSIKGDYPGAYLGMAIIHQSRGEIDAASAAYARVIDLKPDTPNIMLAFANHLRDNGKRQEAMAMYRRSLSIMPRNSSTLFNAGVLALKLGFRDEAVGYYETLRSIDRQLASSLKRCLDLNIW